MEEVKKCPGCTETKELKFFHKDLSTKSGLGCYCKECQKKKWSNYISKNREKRNNYTRQWNKDNPGKATDSALKYKYGITIEEYNEMSLLQNNLCIICKRPEVKIDKRYGTPRKLVMDHDHNNSMNRSLLCGNCNSALGLFQDSPELLKKAADYIEFHKERHERIIMEEKQNLEVAVPLTELVSTP